MISKTKTILSHKTIETLARANFGEWVRVAEVSELTEGFFNAVYVLSFDEPVEGYNEMVLKVGVQPDKYILTYEKDIMRTEVAVYHLLAKNGVPAPKVLRSDFSRKLVSCDYFFMEKLTGATWDKLTDKLTPENSKQLQYNLGRYTARLHSIKGDYFGYIKDDETFHFQTWGEAFRSFIINIIEDGRRSNIELPYVEILETFEPYWPILDEVKEPSLVNYDMWSKNILLLEKDGEYVIDGIIDHERSFYGDPIAEFISTITICGELANAVSFQKGYGEESGKPFTFSKNEQIRFCMYNVYLGLLAGVEIYRYEEENVPKFLEMSKYVINRGLSALKELGK